MTMGPPAAAAPPIIRPSKAGQVHRPTMADGAKRNIDEEKKSQVFAMLDKDPNLNRGKAEAAGIKMGSGQFAIWKADWRRLRNMEPGPAALMPDLAQPARATGPAAPSQPVQNDDDDLTDVDPAPDPDLPPAIGMLGGMSRGVPSAERTGGRDGLSRGMSSGGGPDGAASPEERQRLMEEANRLFGAADAQNPRMRSEEPPTGRAESAIGTMDADGNIWMRVKFDLEIIMLYKAWCAQGYAGDFAQWLSDMVINLHEEYLDAGIYFLKGVRARMPISNERARPNDGRVALHGGGHFGGASE